MMRNVPIRRKLMLIILGTAVAVMLMMRGAFFTYELITFRKATVRQVTTMSEILAANSTAALAFDNQEDAREILSALQAERHVVAAALYDRAGHLFARYPDSVPLASFPAAPPADGMSFTESRLFHFQPVVQKERRLGTLYLEFDTAAGRADFIRGSIVIALVVMAVVLLITYLISRKLEKQISRPILSLTETARAITEQADYSVRAVKHGHDEIGQLTDSFNQMLARLQDLTHELETRVKQRTAQLEAANKELEAFSYSVSHDLRAPLRHIDGFAGLLMKSDGAAVSAKGQGYLRHIMASAKEMGLLVDDLLVFARMGRAEMRMGPVDLAQLAEETVAGLLIETQPRRVQWIRGPLPTVHGDRPMLRQVLVNLFANAVKYSRPRDPAVIEFGCRDGEAGELVVFVRDNGVGFDMKYAGKLFGVFQRLHRAEEFEGTGIGLANVQRIVSRHGGRVWAESQLDVGSTFYFTLPQSKPTP
jgi:signal transduction histidine kinase